MLEISARSPLIDVAGLRVGGVLALAGPSGAGKTSLLRIAAGLARPASGRVTCGADTWLDVERNIDVPPERRRCGLVFQHHALFPHMTALANVRYGARGDGARARALLERLGIAHRAQARPRELSGGERQRVALARTLAARPAALLLDEPLASLDPRTRAAAGRELAEVLAAAGVPAIVVTHAFAEASLLAGEVAVLDRGRLVQRGTPSELASSPSSGFVADFTGAIVLTGSARPGRGGLTAVALDGGGEVESTDLAGGRVAVSVHPWDIALGTSAGSAHNRLNARVTTVTRLGNRTRVGLTGGLAAEITTESADRLGLGPGVAVDAVWKAAATRLLPL
ncbi:MAG TPA: ABC transporter ATP-binding protein [Thermoleophilaceae bacterium]|jgi:molybdate transport system ATP-binding protein